jgi:hypothetical protein
VNKKENIGVKVMKNEIYKDIYKYENLYEASNFGNINSINCKGKSTEEIKQIICAINKKESRYSVIKRFNISQSFYFNLRNNSQKYLNKKRVLKQHIGNHGYLYVTLCKNKKHKKFLVHRLVLEAFIGPCPPGMEARHLDGNKLNNNINNLEWTTRSINAKDRVKHGTNKIHLFKSDCRGSKNGMSKFNDNDILKIREMHEKGITGYRIAKIFDVSNSCIYKILNKQSWNHI